MMNMSESVNRQQDDVPRVVPRDHVQPSPDRAGGRGAVRAAVPAIRFNYNFESAHPARDRHGRRRDHTRLAAEGKPGAVMRTGAPYSTWFNGGIRTTSYFHNQIGILTETIGKPDAGRDPVRARHAAAARRRAESDCAWHLPFRTAIEYSITNNYAILDIASKRHEDFLYNMYKMRRTPSTKATATLDDSSEADRGGARGDRGRAGGASRGGENIGPRGGRGGGGFGRGGAPGRDLQQRAPRSQDAATRAASSCRRISRTSPPRRSSSTS